MSNVLDFGDKFQDSLEKEVKKHMDLAEVYLELGDEVAYTDHMELAGSYLKRLEEFEKSNI